MSKLTIWVDNVQKPAVDRITSAWGTRRGVDVNVVFHSFGNIRDDLKTVKADNAPDVIVAAHDWTGDLAANGLVQPLFPSKTLKSNSPSTRSTPFLTAAGSTAPRTRSRTSDSSSTRGS